MRMSKCHKRKSSEVFRGAGHDDKVRSWKQKRSLEDKSLTKYGHVANFGRFMSRGRFATIVSAMRFSSLSECSDELEAPSRWSVVNGFVDAVNQHRAINITPSQDICLDESMSRWYGLGGHQIDIGLPHCVALDRKPENRCEIRTAACGQSGTMLRLEIVGGTVNSRGLAFEDEFSVSAAATLRPVKSWLRTDRIVCGDSWFASVSPAQALMRYKTRFIGVVKGGTRQFPMAYMSALELTSHGDHGSMDSHRDGDCMELLALLWMDRQRSSFERLCSVTCAGESIERTRWRKEDNSTKKVQLHVDIPQVFETYYKTCGHIDRHDRNRQDSLHLEKNFKVKTWSLGVNTTLLSVCIVDAWLLYKHSTGPRISKTQAIFYEKLAVGLVDNIVDCVGLRTAHVDQPKDERIQEGASGIGLHLVPTNKKRKLGNSSASNATYQGRCRICKDSKSKFVCSGCRDERVDNMYVYHPGTGGHYYRDHLRSRHDISDF